MAKFDLEQAAAVAAMMQLISEWTHEVDTNGGRRIKQADLLTKCPWVISSDTYSTRLRVRGVRWHGRDQCAAATSRGPYG